VLVRSCANIASQANGLDATVKATGTVALLQLLDRSGQGGEETHREGLVATMGSRGMVQRRVVARLARRRQHARSMALTRTEARPASVPSSSDDGAWSAAVYGVARDGSDGVARVQGGLLYVGEDGGEFRACMHRAPTDGDGDDVESVHTRREDDGGATR
jgi:hypothetical protein